jgi:IclR family acetate operon transcriptional repressor
VLEALVVLDRSSVGVRELAAAIGLPASSVHRIFTLLVNEGILVRNPDSTYSLGLAYLQLAARAAAKLSIRSLAQPILQRIVDEIDETASLVLYDPGRRRLMFALSVESSHPLRFHIALNEWTPAHAGASGIAICARLSEEESEAILTDAAPPLLPRRMAAQRAAIQRCREVGYAISRGQRIEGAVGLAAPVFDANGYVVGTISLSIPEHRFDSTRERQLGQRVRSATEDLTHQLGGG